MGINEKETICKSRKIRGQDEQGLMSEGGLMV
jgi:hypothetical protein